MIPYRYQWDIRSRILSLCGRSKKKSLHLYSFIGRWPKHGRREAFLQFFFGTYPPLSNREFLPTSYWTVGRRTVFFSPATTSHRVIDLIGVNMMNGPVRSEGVRCRNHLLRVHPSAPVSLGAPAIITVIGVKNAMPSVLLIFHPSLYCLFISAPFFSHFGPTVRY